MQACRQLSVLLTAMLLLAAVPRPATAVKPISDWVEGGLATHFGGAQDGALGVLLGRLMRGGCRREPSGRNRCGSAAAKLAAACAAAAAP